MIINIIGIGYASKGPTGRMVGGIVNLFKESTLNLFDSLVEPFRRLTVNSFDFLHCRQIHWICKELNLI